MSTVTVSPFHLNAETFRKVHPEEFYRRFISQDLRPDGRSLYMSRKVNIIPGSIRTANGSCMVHLGGTSVICGIKAEIAEPKFDSPTSGYVVPNVEIPPLCHSKFKYGPPSEQAQVISQTLHQIVTNPSIFDVRDLCIVEGKAVWVLYADLICINYDGNLLDACWLALFAALKNLQLMRATYDEDEGTVAADPTDIQMLSFKCHPMPVTFGMFDEGITVLDPNDFEEELIDGTWSIMVDEKDQIVFSYKAALQARSLDEKAVITVAKRRAKEIRDLFLKSLA